MEKKEAAQLFFFFFLSHLFSCPLRLKINSYIPLTQHLVELRESSCAEMRGFWGRGGAFKSAIEATPRSGSMAGQQNVPSPSTTHLSARFLKFFILIKFHPHFCKLEMRYLLIFCAKRLNDEKIWGSPQLRRDLLCFSKTCPSFGESIFPRCVHDLYNIAGFFFPPLYAEQPTASVGFLLKKENLNLFFKKKKKKSLSIVILHEASYIIQQDALAP